jgi:hypothetical protein
MHGICLITLKLARLHSGNNMTAPSQTSLTRTAFVRHLHQYLSCSAKLCNIFHILQLLTLNGTWGPGHQVPEIAHKRKKAMQSGPQTNTDLDENQALLLEYWPRALPWRKGAGQTHPRGTWPRPRNMTQKPSSRIRGSGFQTSRRVCRSVPPDAVGPPFMECTCR